MCLSVTQGVALGYGEIGLSARIICILTHPPLNWLYNHGRAGMAGMPYPPTDCRSYIKINMNTYLRSKDLKDRKKSISSWMNHPFIDVECPFSVGKQRFSVGEYRFNDDERSFLPCKDTTLLYKKTSLSPDIFTFPSIILRFWAYFLAYPK